MNDAVGFWQLVSALKIDMGENKPERVKQFTFDLVRALLARGPNAAWRDLGRDPYVGDIAWFGYLEPK